MINYVGRFNVVPSIPEKLLPLKKIAYNLFWTWNQDAIELFRRLDKKLWEETHHNPVLMLGKISQDRLSFAANDDSFVSHMNRVDEQLKIYLEEKTWYQKNYNIEGKNIIAYFSAEFGLTECLQIYSGGLGVLSGDHLKSASDLGLPLVGVGLCYKEGYFQQYLSNDGWQHERYEITDFYNQPMNLVKDKNGEPLKIQLDFPNRTVTFQIWKIDVGRIGLYLLDTNVPENNDEDKKITRTLYGGNIETRIQQEIVLGIGGIRALHAMNIKPYVCHMNEGHSAFLALERIRLIMKYYNLTFNEAKDVNFYSNVFTTHTPVPAGIDIFPNELIEKYFGFYYRNELQISDKQFYSLGTIIKDKPPVNFNMAHLAMNMAGYVNGVSKLHGVVSKKMWQSGFPQIPFDEIPIDSITNGVHQQTHLSKDMNELLYRYLGERFRRNPADDEVWKSVDEIPDEELWRTHERRRERLVAFARNRLTQQVIERGGSATEIAAAREVLDVQALTIGFARRFATYKRATLIFRDLDRLASIVSNPDYPVQFIIAGKAHPQDEEGKKLIQEIIQYTKEPHLRKKIVFLENYDMNVARYMVEGCDVWLNNPRRPLEASGTSGMKVIANGGLNFSIMDGWWDEAYQPDLGWKIGNREEYTNLEYQDEIESRIIYETIEKEIVPIFYNRGEDKLPRSWITMMKNSMKKLGPVFNTHRMVEEYSRKFYFASYDKRMGLQKNNWKHAKEFSAWKTKLYENWNRIKFINITEEGKNDEFKVGMKYPIIAEIELGDLTPDDVEVQIYFGKVDNGSNANKFVNMENIPKKGKEHYYYRGEIDCNATGQFGYTLRVLPKHDILINPFELGLVKWAAEVK
ncbi:alpha-glucan family phosphorylase [Stygiobacter electus]|uniref:Alpha-glucan family phosphorylase n=1 Tax=Stygiobacter electus TaxID=3032292 RepID=A0AAE3P040_9BACT|nr:alpha-glucan family phosphorylase [Stygiobacter electus]MDF1610598.1 alpha-glucan family phosphorylase [Stygiobacter electus]